MTTSTGGDGTAPVGLRERKREETRLRIAQTALGLFLAQGYEHTTLDAIAQAAGISRRSFFAYFKSKEDIVIAWQAAAWETVLADVLAASPDEAPLDVVRDVLVKHAARYATGQMKAMDQMMLASETLVARKQAFYVTQEKALHAALCEVWRQPQRQAGLRFVAMASIGAMRLAIEAWRAQPAGEDRPIVVFLQEAFARLKAEI